MTTDELELLRDFKADEVPIPSDEMRQRIYGYATSAPTASRSSRLRLPSFRLRFALPVAAAICAAVAAVVFTGALGGAKQPKVGPARPAGYSPINYEVTRSSGAIASMTVTVQAALTDATAQIEVLRGPLGSTPTSWPTTGQVVFQEQVPLTNIASPADGPPGTVALSQWSGTLSPSGWDGGCQNAPYWITVQVTPVQPTQVQQDEGSQSGWFRCSS